MCIAVSLNAKSCRRAYAKIITSQKKNIVRANIAYVHNRDLLALARVQVK